MTSSCDGLPAGFWVPAQCHPEGRYPGEGLINRSRRSRQGFHVIPQTTDRPRQKRLRTPRFASRRTGGPTRS
eukprot:1032766-Alexandrium_andersonii.AAC.1